VAVEGDGAGDGAGGDGSGGGAGAGGGDGGLVLVVGFRARAGAVDELRQRLLTLVGLTLTEPGCLRYDLHEHPDDPLRLTFVEEWSDAAAHEAHDRTPWVLDLREHLPRLLAEEPQVTRLRRLAA
jgi:quinol monooxygenase YgiN